METLRISTFINQGVSVMAPLGAAKISSEHGWAEGWLQPEDFEVDHFEDTGFNGERYACIILKLDENTASLIDAYLSGQVLVYDDDYDIQVTADEDGGNPEIEIFWAVKYRGGLSLWEGYSVHSQHDVDYVLTLQEARKIVDKKWVAEAKPDYSGFVNPWIEDNKGEVIDYTPVN